MLTAAVSIIHFQGGKNDQKSRHPSCIEARIAVRFHAGLSGWDDDGVFRHPHTPTAARTPSPIPTPRLTSTPLPTDTPVSKPAGVLLEALSEGATRLTDSENAYQITFPGDWLPILSNQEHLLVDPPGLTQKHPEYRRPDQQVEAPRSRVLPPDRDRHARRRSPRRLIDGLLGDRGLGRQSAHPGDRHAGGQSVDRGQCADQRGGFHLGHPDECRGDRESRSYPSRQEAGWS